MCNNPLSLILHVITYKYTYFKMYNWNFHIFVKLHRDSIKVQYRFFLKGLKKKPQHK